VEKAASGRGRASTLWLPFATEGPWWDGEINAQLFEVVLGYSRARGAARLLIAAMAALADDHGVVTGFTTELVCAAAGISDRTYRRAHGPLLTSGELLLRSGAGGRKNTNCWEIPDPRQQERAVRHAAARRVTPPVGARPLVATVASPINEELAGTVNSGLAGLVIGGEKGGQARTASAQNRPEPSGVSAGTASQDGTISTTNRPELTGVCPENRPGLSGVSARKGGQVRTLSAETPAPRQKPRQLRRPTRAGGGNPRTPEPFTPPAPLKGGALLTSCWSRRRS
jgi:hypothetical protein